METDNPEQPEQRYYLYDGSQTVRQTVNEQAEPTYAWTFSPEGAVLLGEEGPASHLSCVGDAVYDWSTGLIYKNGKYYDPRSDLWLTFGSPAVVWAVGRWYGSKRKDKKQDKRFFWLLFLLLVLFVLAGCQNAGTPTPGLPATMAPKPTETCTPIPTSTPESIPALPPPVMLDPTSAPTVTATNTAIPTPTITIFFGGSRGQAFIKEEGPQRGEQTFVWDNPEKYILENTPYQIAENDWYQYTGSKNTHAIDAMNNITRYENSNLYVIGYSAGADTALIFADLYYKHKDSSQASGHIKGLALLGPTLTDPDAVLSPKIDDVYKPDDPNAYWRTIMNDLLDKRGTKIYALNDNGIAGDHLGSYFNPNSPTTSLITNDRWYDVRNQEHISDKDGTNSNLDFQKEVTAWLYSNP